MLKLSLESKLYFIFRIAIAMCFIGHGAFGIITKQVWCNYFGVFGIGPDMACDLMPVVGSMDILMGILMIVYPMRIVPGWLVFWGIFTALLRPLSGEPLAEFLERAGNYGIPFALLLLLSREKYSNYWFSKIKSDFKTDSEVIKKVDICLRITAFLLLAGHGWLNLILKQGLLSQYQSLGFSNTILTAQVIGILEIAAAFIILVKPIPNFLIIVFILKVISELFYPQYPFWEWVERGGSYTAILSLWLIRSKLFSKTLASSKSHEPILNN